MALASHHADSNIPNTYGFSTQFESSDLKWRYIIGFLVFHIASALSFLNFPYMEQHQTSCWMIIVTIVSGFGVGAGAHRLWAHQSYKAKKPLRIFLIICNSVAGMTSAYHWARGHRVHHKFVDTNADPHNSRRGVFFSHIGWIMIKEHKDVTRKSSEIEMSDIHRDNIAMWGLKYNKLLTLLCCFILPTLVPVYCWGENIFLSIISQSFMRYSWVLNASWSVNSFAHTFGYRPYNRMIRPTEISMVSYATCGEGWHNYHHTFPWDYKAAEIGHYSLTTASIELFSKIGWAYDLKQASAVSVKSMIQNKGNMIHFGN